MEILHDKLSESIMTKILNEELMKEKAYSKPIELPHKNIENAPELLQGNINDEIKPARILEKILDKLILAQKFIEICPIYYDEAGLFWQWSEKEKVWKMTDEINILNLVHGASESNIISSKERTEIMNAIKQIARQNKPKELDEFEIQFDKEIINIKTGDKRIATSEYFCINPIPHKIGDYRKVEKFDLLFSQWVAPDNIENLYEIIGFCFIRKYFIERIIALIGSGSNGKSVYRQLLRNVIGDKNVCSTSLEILSKSRFEQSKLFNKMVCEMGETNLQKMENTQNIKKLVSGKDLIGGEFKNKNPFDFLNYAKMIISTNNLPPTDDKTDGFYRKWLIIEFPNTFQKEIDLISQFTEEDYENLTARCFQALDNLLTKRRFSNEGDFQKRREKYEEKSNPFEKFWKDFVDDSDPNKDISKREFANKLNDWLKENKMRIMSDVTINQMIKGKGFQDKIKDKMWYDSANSQGKNISVRVWEGIQWK